MGNDSQKKFLYAIIYIIALLAIGYVTRDHWYPTIIENCRECGLKYFPEYSPTPSSNVTFIPHQHPPPPYTETVPPTEMPSLNLN